MAAALSWRSGFQQRYSLFGLPLDQKYAAIRRMSGDEICSFLGVADKAAREHGDLEFLSTWYRTAKELGSYRGYCRHLGIAYDSVRVPNVPDANVGADLAMQRIAVLALTFTLFERKPLTPSDYRVA